MFLRLADLQEAPLAPTAVCGSQIQFGEARMVVGAPPQRPE